MCVCSIKCEPTSRWSHWKPVNGKSNLWWTHLEMWVDSQSADSHIKEHYMQIFYILVMLFRYACSCNTLVTYLLLADCIYTFLPQSAPSLFLKSNFEYLRGNYRKAVKLLNSSNIAEHPGPLKTGTQLKTTHICFKKKEKNGSPFQSEHISFFVFMWDLYTIIIYIFDSKEW